MMRSGKSRLDRSGVGRTLRRFKRSDRGVAAIEFALTLPVLALLLVGGVELLTYFWAAGRANDASSAVGDIVAQNTTIDETAISAIFNASEAVVSTNSAADVGGGDVTATASSAIACPCSEGSDDFCYTVLWSHTFMEGELAGGRTPGDEIDIVPAELAISAGDTVIVSETAYRYAPKLNWVLTDTTYTFEETTFFRPRLSDRVTHFGGQRLDPEPNCDTIEDAF